MQDALVVFASLTAANRVKAILAQEYTVKSTVMQTPKALALAGCSYCIKANQSHVDLILDIIKKMGVSTKGAYSATDYAKIR